MAIETWEGFSSTEKHPKICYDPNTNVMLVNTESAPQIKAFITIEKIVKGLLLLLAYLYLAVFWQFSQNGRYVPHENEQGVFIVDTRTGEISIAKYRPDMATLPSH